MATEQDRLKTVVVARLLRFNVVLHGLVSGVLGGLLIFVATNWLVLKGGAVVGPHLALLGQFFPGYRVSFTGSLVGLGYGFLAGFAAGSVIAWLYNRLLDLKSGGPPRR